MDRKSFLSSLGLSAGTVLIASCLGGCRKPDSPGSVVTPPAAVDFTLDLTQPSNAALRTGGGYLYSNGVIVAKTLAGDIIAVSQVCTHQGVSVQFVGSNNSFFCPGHGAGFNTSGTVTNGPATTSLKKYTVTVTGNSVRVNG